MSTSLLYHAFGVRGYQYQSTQYYDGGVYIWVRQEPETWRCATCGSRDVVGRGKEKRSFHALPIGKRRVTIVLPVPRVECRHCGAVRQVPIPFARPRCTYTQPFQRYALDLCRHMTMQDVADHLGVGWDMIKDMQARDLKRRFSRPKLKKLKQIAIDEIAIGRGRRFLTVVLDLESGCVVYVGDGKGADAVKPFWKRLRAAHARVRAVAMDMSLAYVAAVRDNLPKALIVFDRFHIVKLFNEKLSDLRRVLQREAEDRMHQTVLKGTRWLLLKNPENLDEKRGERERLAEALRLNAPLATAYYLKEDLRQIWEQPDKGTARRVLKDWIARAQTSGIRMLHKFAQTLQAYRNGILAWYDYAISTGPLEGTNNKIKTMKRQAYGFRDLEFFKLKILAIHECDYALLNS